jgi:hypothetical protein
MMHVRQQDCEGVQVPVAGGGLTVSHCQQLLGRGADVEVDTQDVDGLQ